MLIEKLGSLMGIDVGGLVLDSSVVLETWELVETLIVNGLVEHSCYSNLVNETCGKEEVRLDLCLY
jgi:hypothetical protein